MSAIPSPTVIGEVHSVDLLHKDDPLQAVRSSCREAVGKSDIEVRSNCWVSGWIVKSLTAALNQISDSAVDQFLSSLDKHQYEELAIDSPMRMPVRFDNLAQELNFIALIDLLNFGSGYRVPLHKHTGRG